MTTLEQDKYEGLGNGPWNEGYFPTAKQECIWNIPEDKRHCEFCTANCVNAHAVSTSTNLDLKQERRNNMKQNELFNKCCENIDPKTREEVWKQMDKELGRTELEQAAANYVTQWYKTNYDSPSILLEDIDDAFKAGAEWQKRR